MMEPIKQYRQTIEIQHYSQETIKSYSFHIDKFRRYYGDNLTEQNIHRHLHYLTIKGFSAATINITRAALLYYANKILKKEINAKSIETAKRPKPLPKPIEMDIIEKIIDNTLNLKHKIVLEVLYGSGLRLGETSKIRWEDINFIEGILRVNRGKGNKDRLVKLGQNVIRHILDYKELRFNKNSPYLFDSMARPTTHITKKTIQKILENSCKKAGINQHYHIHQLRHSYATHSLEAGVDIRKIQEALGHSSPKTTMIYTKVTKDTIKGMISPLDLIYQKKIKSNSSCVDSEINRNSGCNN